MYLYCADMNDLWTFNTSSLDWRWMGGNGSAIIPQLVGGSGSFFVLFFLTFLVAIL
jgi:hypothetical protein